MNEFQRTKDAFTRRTFVTGAAQSLLGLGAMPLFGSLANAAVANGNRPRAGAAQAVIYIYLSGGMSHLDTFDTKPGAETQGPVESINTSADGVQISEYFPTLANHMDKVAVINSMNSTQGAHEQGRYYMHTSYQARGTIRHPDMGAWTALRLGKRNSGMPANIKIGNTKPGNGFLEASYGAVPIGNPSDGLQHSTLPRSVGEEQFALRKERLKKMNQAFTSKYDTRATRANSEMYDEAVRLMKSKDLEAFDLTLESRKVRDSYGQHSFGQGCLLARRLVENGVRFIEVGNGGWDTHANNFDRVAEKSAVLDQSLAALLDDLSSRGLLESTLVVVATEFGRTPTIQTERDNGRGHYPGAFSCLLAGGGIKGGIKYGKTDKEGREVVENRVSVPSFNATIAHALGIDLEEKTMSPTLRPFTVADKGKPILDLFA